MPDHKPSPGLIAQLPTDRLTAQGQQLLGLVAERAIDRAVHSVEDLAERLVDYVYHGGAHHGGPGLTATITGRGGDAGSPRRATAKAGITGISESVRHALAGVCGPHRSGRTATTVNIAEHIDVGVPLRLAYDQWTLFQYSSPFTKNVGAETNSDEAGSWKGQVFWSHPDWEMTIIEQVPDERIIWRSAGPKGRLDGAVSFHAMTPTMTRILVALEYSPHGVLERTGTRWRDQGRRTRRDITRFRQHVMIRAVLDPDSVQGWRSEIRDRKVVRTHKQASAADELDEAEEDIDADTYAATYADTYADTNADSDDDYADDEAERVPARPRRR